jgi:hypothetical protein
MRYRSAITGLYVDPAFAAANPDTTYAEGQKRPKVTEEMRETERERLKELLRASLGQPGYADRAKAIQAELDKLDG